MGTGREYDGRKSKHQALWLTFWRRKGLALEAEEPGCLGGGKTRETQPRTTVGAPGAVPRRLMSHGSLIKDVVGD